MLPSLLRLHYVWNTPCMGTVQQQSMAVQEVPPCVPDADEELCAPAKGRRWRPRWPCSPRKLATAVFALASLGSSPGLLPYALTTGPLVYLLCSQ